MGLSWCSTLIRGFVPVAAGSVFFCDVVIKNYRCGLSHTCKDELGKIWLSPVWLRLNRWGGTSWNRSFASWFRSVSDQGSYREPRSITSSSVEDLYICCLSSLGHNPSRLDPLLVGGVIKGSSLRVLPTRSRRGDR
jgi:hypothetical protein